MYKTKKVIIPFLLIFAFASCNGKNENNEVGKQSTGDTIVAGNDTNTVVAINLNTLRGKIKFYFSTYQTDTCKVQNFNEANFLKGFEGIKEIGDVNSDVRPDSVFVLPPLNMCENGQSYYFSDTKLPRLYTESNCCHPENVFMVGDIDEDGVSEIGQYFSSCASRYKSLYVYSLKDNRWKEVGHCVYDLNFSGEKENYHNYIKKTGKGTFEMLEFTDLTKDKSKVGKKNWLKFKM